MLSENDLEKIRQIIREELTICDVEVQRVGPDGIVEKKTIDLYLPDWLAAEIPNMGSALRGVQETADHAKNNSWKLLMGMDKALTKFHKQILLAIENKYEEAEVLKIESDS